MLARFRLFFRSTAYLTIIAGFALPAYAIHETGPVFTRISEPTSIPTEISCHAMYVSVMIKDKGPFRMLIDTGCSVSLVSPAVAQAVEAHDVNIDGEYQEDVVVNGVGDSSSLPRVLLDSVVIGGVRFEGVIADVQSLDLQSKIDGRAVDGILGYGLFADVYCALDFPNRRLILSADWPKDLPPVRAALTVTERNLVPYVSAKLQDWTIEVMVDTGANQGLQLSSEGVGLFKWKTEPRPGSLIALIGETGRGWVGRLEGELDLGGVRQLDPSVAISRGRPSIGVGLLQPFCVVFHEAENKLWLCSTSDGPVPSPSERSIGLSLYSDDAGWRVAGIIPGSPAEKAHVNTGQLVTQIEGRPARAWSRDQIQDWIDTHDDVELAIAEPTGQRDLKLRVWSLVP